MLWKESPMANWVEAKIAEFNFPYTVFLIGDWENHTNNLTSLGSHQIFWFAMHKHNPYSSDFIPFYFVTLMDAKYAQEILDGFKKNKSFVYARFYKGKQFVKAFKKKSE